MPEPLPQFRYHPNPIQTGVLSESGNVCRACGRARGVIYTGPVYAEVELHDAVCPWCIADGSAAAKFNATFCDDYSLVQQGAPVAIIQEVTCRTPGYISWQSEYWPAHCNDACECHGDLQKKGLAEVDGEAKAWLCKELQIETDNEWRDLIHTYEPAGQPAIYLFICRHCKAKRYHWDCD
jgi:uncharacterized protein